MKRTYIQPSATSYTISIQGHILDVSGGVTNGSKLGNGYNANDVSYTKEGSEHTDIWNLYE